jgi:hypothetical protein
VRNVEERLGRLHVLLTAAAAFGGWQIAIDAKHQAVEDNDFTFINAKINIREKKSNRKISGECGECGR